MKKIKYLPCIWQRSGSLYQDRIPLYIQSSCYGNPSRSNLTRREWESPAEPRCESTVNKVWKPLVANESFLNGLWCLLLSLSEECRLTPLLARCAEFGLTPHHQRKSCILWKSLSCYSQLKLIVSSDVSMTFKAIWVLELTSYVLEWMQ